MDRDLNRKLAATVVFFGLAIVVIVLLLPDAGARQFEAMNRALQNARAWRSRRTLQEPGRRLEETMEVYCPSHIHVRNRFSAEPAGERLQMDSETIHIEGVTYTRQGDAWTADSGGGPFSSVCAWGARGVDGLLGQMDSVVRFGRIRKGAKRTVNGVPCREWTGSVPAPSGWRDSFVVCIGARDLPLEVRTPDRSQVTTYSDWDQPILIEPPAPAEIRGRPVPN